jgi:xanthine dehydrogenase accessory factor
MKVTDMLAKLDELQNQRTGFVLATVVRAERPTSAKPGDRALVLADGTMEGFVGGTCAESTVRLHGMRLLRTGESILLRITPDAEDETVPESVVPLGKGPVTSEGMLTVENHCLSGGTLDIFLEAMLPPLLIGVHGDAPVARALRMLCAAMGYAATDDLRGPGDLPGDLQAVLVASHGRDEEAVLARALRARVPYVGLVASPKRGAAVLSAVDVSEEERALVHTPAGLDIGARSPEEVALSVLAEMIALRPQERPEPVPIPEQQTPVSIEALDPVCGMTVAVSDSSLSTVHDGAPYYFCGSGCLHAFTDNPVRYLS